MIAFVGSVFSPYYAAARRRGPTDPENHVAINVALYGPGGRWAMTERGTASLKRSATRFQVGPSMVRLEGGKLIVDVNERSAPFFRPVRGQIEITLGPTQAKAYPLDAAGRHLWQPIAPLSKAKVTFEAPALSWEGAAYVDSNSGSEPLEKAFRYWTWSRTRKEDGATLFYDVERRDGSRHGIALDFAADGSVATAQTLPEQGLPGTLWRMRRSVRAISSPSKVVTFEDAPFYTRSSVTTADGAETVCESVDLDRFSARWVQTLLPFRMPRLVFGRQR